MPDELRRPEPPSFLGLMRANLLVSLGALVAGLCAWLAWRWLTAWLQR